MDDLTNTLGSVNQWLKFAEAKNGVVVAATGAALWGALRMIVSGEVRWYLTIYLLVLVAFFLAAFVVSLLSFLPKLYPPPALEQPDANDGNLLYFGHLATLSKELLIERYREAACVKADDITKIHWMYADQIIVNSRITLAKFSMFTTSAKLLLYGILTPIIAFPLIYLFTKRTGVRNGNG